MAKVTTKDDRQDPRLGVGGYFFFGLLLGLVPAFGSFCLGGLGLAALAGGLSKWRSSRAHQSHAPVLDDATAVALGQLITVVGPVEVPELIQPTLFAEPVALSVCTGFHQTDNEGNRAELFSRVKGGPVQIACGGWTVELDSSRADLLSEPVKNITAKVSEEPRFSEWFAQWVTHEGPQRERTFEFEEAVVTRKDTLTATGVVSAIAVSDPAGEADSGPPRQRLTLVAGPGGKVELTTLSPADLRLRSRAGLQDVQGGAMWLVLGALSGVGWYALAVTHGWIH